MQALLSFIIFFALSAVADDFCLDYFLRVDQRVPLLQTEEFSERLFQSLAHAENLKIRLHQTKSGEILGGDQSRLASYILNQLRRQVDVAIYQMYQVRTLQDLANVSSSLLGVEVSLKEVQKNAGAVNPRILEAYKLALTSRDQTENSDFSATVLGRNVSENLQIHLTNITVESNVSLKKVLEKWIQIKFILSKNHGYQEPRDAMMLLLTKLALARGVESVGEVYALGRKRISSRSESVSEIEYAALILQQFHKSFKSNQVYLDYKSFVSTLGSEKTPE